MRLVRLCPICEKREANSVTGGTGVPLETLCSECLEARIKADLAQAIETFRHFKDAPGVVIDPNEPHEEKS